jgi:hypothetical protein
MALVRERIYRPSHHRLSAKLVPTFADIRFKSHVLAEIGTSAGTTSFVCLLERAGSVKVNSLAVGFFSERSFSVYYQTVSEVTAIQKNSW